MATNNNCSNEEEVIDILDALIRKTLELERRIKEILGKDRGDT